MQTNQISFAQGVFEDDELSFDRKEYWLNEAASGLQNRNDQIEAREYLEKLRAGRNESLENSIIADKSDNTVFEN